MLNALVLSVLVLSAVILSAIMLSAAAKPNMLRAILPNVVMMSFSMLRIDILSVICSVLQSHYAECRSSK